MVTNQNPLAGLAQMFQQMAVQTQAFSDDLTALSIACCTPIEDDEMLNQRMAMIDALFS